MLEISHNSTSIGRSCWRKYELHYLEGLSPKKKLTSLTLGTAEHKAFELYYNGATDSDVINYLSQSFDEEISKAELVDQEDLVVTKHTALGMWAYYPYKDRDEFEECMPEVEFCVPLTGKRGVRFVGRVDGLVKKDGHWWVREVKTTGLTPRQFKGRCATSSQATGYVYALRHMGYDIKGVLYDTIKKPLLRKRVNEDQEAFGLRIMADYRDDLKMPENERKAYLRHYEYRSDRQMRNWIEDTCLFVDDLRWRMKKDKWYRNMDSCWMWNNLCQYDRICHEKKPDTLTLDLFYERSEHGGRRRIRETVDGEVV